MRRFLAALALLILLVAGGSALAGPRRVWCTTFSLVTKGITILPAKEVCIPCPPTGCPMLPGGRGSAGERA